MEAGSFDRLTRMLAGRLSRRAGLAAGLAALATGSINGAAGSRNSNVTAETGPCGPDPADNRCKKDKDCCTRFCKKRNSGDPVGRCRCITRGEKCRKDQTCCGTLICRGGRCSRPAPTPPPPPPANLCTVCASGCAFADVNVAYAAAAPGATITIAPGTWTTGILVTKNATLSACGTSGEVILQADASATSPDNYQFIISEDGVDTTTYTITLENLVFRGNGPVGNDCLLLSKTIGNVSFVVNGGSGRETSSVFCLGGGDHVVSNMTTDLTVGSAFTGDFSYIGSGSVTATNCQFQSQDATFFMDGNYGPAQRPNTAFTFTTCTFTSVNAAGIDIGGGQCSFTGCTVSGCGDGGCFLNDGDFTFTDCTITGNTSATDYSAIYLYNLNNDPSSLTIAGSTTVTGNTTGTGPGGIGIDSSFGPITVTGATTSNVFGNTSPYQCGIYNGTSWSDNPTCSF